MISARCWTRAASFAEAEAKIMRRIQHRRAMSARELPDTAGARDITPGVLQLGPEKAARRHVLRREMNGRAVVCVADVDRTDLLLPGRPDRQIVDGLGSSPCAVAASISCAARTAVVPPSGAPGFQGGHDAAVGVFEQ